MKRKHNDIDNVLPERNNNDIDNVGSYVRRIVAKNISEEKLTRVQEFLFGGQTFGTCKTFINPAIKQIERFVHLWYTEIDEADRKVIAGMYLEYDGDGRTRPYKDYTESPLWKYTSSIIKTIRGFTCEKCRKQCLPAHLVAHHKSYEHLGSELAYLDEMELLCNDCHMKEHGIRRSK